MESQDSKGQVDLRLISRASLATNLRPADDDFVPNCQERSVFTFVRSFEGKVSGALYRLREEARLAGYKDLYADTLKSMASALRMYREIGFSEVGPYSDCPTGSAVFLKFSL